MKPAGIENQNLSDIMEDMRKLVGKVVRISVKESKPKTHWEEREGVIEGVYPTVFLFRFKNRRNVDERVAYSYIDVAIDDVKIWRFCSANYALASLWISPPSPCCPSTMCRKSR